MVVEGVNSSRVVLNWKYKKLIKERILSVSYFRQLPGKGSSTRLAVWMPGDKNGFTYSKPEFKTRYKAKLPSTLVLWDVENSEECRYTFRITYNSSLSIKKRTNSKISVDVFGKYKSYSLFSLFTLLQYYYSNYHYDSTINDYYYSFMYLFLYNSRLMHSASELSGVTCRSSLTMNEKYRSIPHEALPSTVSKISSSLSVNEYRLMPII